MQSQRISHKQTLAPGRSSSSSPSLPLPTLLPSTWEYYLNDSGDTISLGFPNWT
jgi:hypothetical protein